MTASEELPDGFSFDDFLAALDEVDRPDDVDLPTDWDGCALLATMPLTEIAATIAKLGDAGLEVHTELPDGEEIDRNATGSVFVPFAMLRRARAVLGLEA